MQTLDLNPPGGLERLAASGVALSSDQVEAVRRSQNASVDADIPVMLAFPTAVEPSADGGLHLTAITKCGLCKRLHFVGLSEEPLRRPECSDGFPPFHNGREKPELIRVLPVLDVLPDELVFAAKAEKCDLATFVKIALETGDPVPYATRVGDLRNLRRATHRRATPWRRHHTEAACQAIIRARVLEERISIIAEGLDLPEPQQTYAARRQALAQFIRRHGPGKMRLRLGRALYAALRAVASGEV